MIEPYEIGNLLWVAAFMPQWLPRALEILEGREERSEQCNLNGMTSNQRSA